MSHFDETLKPFIRSFLTMQLVFWGKKSILCAKILVQESI